MRISIDEAGKDIQGYHDDGHKVDVCTRFCLVTVAEKSEGLVITVHSRMTHFNVTVDPEGFTKTEYDSPNIVFDKEEPALSLEAEAGS
jgi:hypothetical protein